MNDFWPPRGPNLPGNNFQQPMMDPNDYSMQRSQSSQPSGSFNNNNQNEVVDLKDHLMTGQESSNNFNQSGSFQINQQQPASPSAENSSHETKFNGEKFVNEIQVSF